MKATRADISNTQNVSPFLLLESRQDHLISLRKKKINNMLTMKRKGKFNEASKFVPYINEKTISQSVYAPSSFTPKEQLAFYIKQISTNFKDLNTFFFILNKINCTLGSFDNELELLKAIEECKLVDYLMVYLKGSLHQNKIVTYHVYIIFQKISLIADNQFIEKILLNAYNCEIFIEALSWLKEDLKENQEIISIIIIFLGNLISENVYFQHILYTYNMLDLIIEFLDEESLVTDCITFCCLFAAVKEFPDDTPFRLYEIFSRYLFRIVNSDSINRNIDLVKDLIWGLSFVTFANTYEEIPSLFIKDNTVNIILKINESLPEISMCIQKAIIFIIGNLSSFDCIDCSVFYNEQTAKFIINNLLYSHPQTQTEILWLISNLAIGTDMQCLHQYTLLSTMTSSVINCTVSFSIAVEIMKTICSLIYSSTNPHNMLTADVVNAIISFSKGEANDEVKTISIVMIDAVIKYGKEEMKRLLQLSNIKENIDKWSITTEQKEIREEAIKLSEEMNEYMNTN